MMSTFIVKLRNDGKRVVWWIEPVWLKARQNRNDGKQAYLLGEVVLRCPRNLARAFGPR